MTPLVTEVSVNGSAAASAIIVQRDAAGGFYLPVTIARAHRLRLENLPETIIDGAAYIRLADLKGLTVVFNESAQRLELAAPASLFEATKHSISLRDTIPMTPSGTGFFLNYDVLGEARRGGASLSAALELGLFRGGSFAQTSAVMRLSSDGYRAIRLDSSWTFDDPDRMRSVRIGDTISRGGVGGTPLRLGGIQFARNFAVQPNFVTLPMINLSGSTGLPSSADIYVNGALVSQSRVLPGPFTLGNIPVVTGNGQVEAVVRDSLGRETLIRQAYYASPVLLRSGLQDFSYEIGFPRDHYGQKSAAYRPIVGSATHRLGLSDWLTAEGHAEASARTQAIAAAVDFALPRMGLAGISLAGSRSSAGAGTRIGVRFEQRSARFSLGGSAEFSSRRFRSLGLGENGIAPRRSVQAFTGLPTAFGSLSASYLLRKARGAESDVEFIGAGASMRLRRLGTLNLSARHSLRANGGTALQAYLALPLGGGRSGSASVRDSGGTGAGGLLASTSVQRNAPAGEGWGYRMSATTGAVDQVSARIEANTRRGEYSGDIAYGERGPAARIAAAGAIGNVDGYLFASRKLTDSFAVIEVAGQQGVRIYADNHLVGSTDKRGKSVIPRLRAYGMNDVRVEIADIPLDVEVNDGRKIVRPFGRSGISLNFEAKRQRSAMLRITTGATALAAGATVRVRDRTFVSAPGGQVFLSGLEDVNVLDISWEGGRCALTINLPKTAGVQSDLGVGECQPLPVQRGSS